MNIRNMISAWRTIKIPGLWPLMRDWIPFLRMHFLYAALDAGLLQALQTSATREELITKLDVRRPELLDALLDMGLALKELTERNAHFSLRGKRSRVLATQQGDALAAIVQANVTYYNNAYRHLADRMRGAPLGDDLDEIGNIVARFSKIGEPILNGFIASLSRRSGPLRILDVGCGSGFVLKTVRQANAEARGIGIDMDAQVTHQARDNMKQWGLEDHFNIITGDIRAKTTSMQGRFDLITVFNLIYYLPMNERCEFFGMLHSLLSPNGCLAIANNFQSAGKDTAAANLNIVNVSLNNLTTLPELESTIVQLRESGFEGIQTTRFMPGSKFFGLTAYG